MSMEYPCVYFEKDGKCRKFSDDTVISYCVMGPCSEQKLSNADRIRAMIDIEIGDFGPLMDIEKLIEQLNDWNEKYISNLCGDRTIKCEEYCIKDDCLIVKAATALSTLQAENEKLRDELEQERDHRIHAEQHADAFLKDCERLNAQLERVTEERDAAVRNSIFILTKKEDTP